MMAISASFISVNFNLASGFCLSPLRASPPTLARSGSWNAPEAVINGHRTWTPLADTKSLKLMTAIKTPYLPDGRIDLEAYDSLLQMQIESGVEGVIVGGITGEGHIMSRDERIMLIGHTVNSFGGSLKVIGNTGSNSTNEAIRATEQGFTVGMHAALHMNPYYGKTTQHGEVSHFLSVLPLGPTIIHNVPTRTAQDIAPQLIDLISDHPNMLGVKECTGIWRIQQHVQRGLVVWSGNDDDGHYAVCESGARGVISVASNLVPGLMRDLMYKGKNPELEHKLEPLFQWLSLQPNPICLNTALAQLGVVRPVFRLPYVPLPIEEQMTFRDIVLRIGRVNFVGKKDIGVLQDDEFKMLPRY